MIDILALLSCVLTLLILIIPGFTLKKLKIMNGDSAKHLNKGLIYVFQPAMLISSYLRPFDAQIMKSSLYVLLFSFLSHLLFTVVAFLAFKKTEIDKRNVYRFAMVFSNAGFMGIPVIKAVLGEHAGIYASFYCVFFQIFIWSVGSFIYTGDKKYMSVKKMILNPGVIPVLIGVVCFITPIGAHVPEVVKGAIKYLSEMVIPVSMMIVGIRLAECELGGIFKNYRLFICVLLRLFALPALFFVLLWGFKLIGFYDDAAAASALICSSAPVAASTNSFAEMYNGDGPEASKLVSISTVLSVVSMPLIAMLLNI